MTIVEQLAEAVAESGRHPLRAGLGNALALHVTDTVGALLAGCATIDGKAILKFYGLDVPGRRTRLDRGEVLTRVAAHGAIARLTEIDGIHLPSGTTPAALIVPAALALCCHLPRPRPGDFASAIIAGLEVVGRFGAAVDGQNLVYKGIWTTYLTAPLGTAMVAARLLRLDPLRTANALAIALTSIAGRVGHPGLGRTSRWLMAGQAARAGCFAAFAAADDFRGDLAILDGPWMENAQGVPLDRQALLRQGGAAIIEEISLKPFCSAKQVIAAITGLRRILDQGVSPQEIRRVTVSVPPNYAGLIGQAVQAGNRLGTATSAAYQLALTALAPEQLYDIERATVLDSPAMADFMGKVSVEADASLGAHLPARWPARIAVETAGGTLTETVVDAPGDPALPLGLAEVGAKALRVAGMLGISGEAVTPLLEAAGRAAGEEASLNQLLVKYREF